MKKYILILMAALMVAMTGFYACDKKPDDADTRKEPNLIGDGSKNNPFKVETVADLKRVGTGEEGPGGKWLRDKHYIQIKDIDLENIDFVPICSKSSEQFKGSYNGSGYTISNLKINKTTEYAGLFAYLIGGATVSNVRLYNVSIQGTKSIGGIAGSTNEGCKIEYCSATNITITGTSSYLGGIVGWNNYQSTISSCLVNGGSITGTGYNGFACGGVAGHNSGIIQNCYATVDVSGYRSAGGVAGSHTNGTMQYCYATGNVTANTLEVGGIAGDNNSKILNCVALNKEVRRTANSESEKIGRIAGYVTGNSTVEMNYNYARNNMILQHNQGNVPHDVPLGTEATLTGRHGASIMELDYTGANSGTWWSNTAGFKSSEWSFENNRLPHLKGLNGLTQNPTVNN
jgi:hypothetical protein